MNRLAALSLCSILLSSICQAETATRDASRVKDYLLKTTERMDAASVEFVQNTAAYQKLIDAHGGDYVKAYAASGMEITKLVTALRENYKAMDSFGYETIEGIVAGVKQLSDFDVYLDAGVPKDAASQTAPIAPVVLHLKNGRIIDQEGCLFTYLIEPTLWGTQKRNVIPLDLNGDGRIDPKESFPDASVLTAVAQDVHKKIEELAAASKAWKPTTADCFAAIIAMTPTLSGYFDDWKESRYAPEKSGRFSAVSRVSDMRGIMSSVAVLYQAVNGEVQARDEALAQSITRGFHDILSFIDRVDSREKKTAISLPEVDEMGEQAKAKADKLVPQVEQAAAILDLKLQGA